MSGAPQVASRRAPGPSPPETAEQPLRRALSRFGAGSLAGPLLAAGVLGVCVVLRFLARPDLWLDEALSVNIARLPLRGLLEALRHDGSPPAYYLLLHAWMAVVGTGDHAVRALSGLISVLTLPVAWEAGRRAGGRVAGWGLVLLLASSPFVIRYATETRMYSMLVLLALVVYLAWIEALRRPTAGWLLILGATIALLLLTHYWAFYLVGALLGVTALRAVTGDRRAALLAAGAMAGGAIPFLLWLPSFFFQLHHTGTPWGRPPDLRSLVGTLQAWTDGGRPAGITLGWMLVLLAAAAVLDRRKRAAGEAPDRRAAENGGEPRSGPSSKPSSKHARDLCLTVFGTFALAIVAGKLFHVSFAARYTSVVVPLFLLLAALGLRSLPVSAPHRKYGDTESVPAPRSARRDECRVPLPYVSEEQRSGRGCRGVRMPPYFRWGALWSRWAVLGLATACGLAVAFANVDLKRTQTGDVARVLRSRAAAGDVIVYCPDQLGPGTSRLAPSGVPQMTFPDFAAPGLVDWVDYRRRYAGASPAAFAGEVDRRAGAGRVWLVYSGRYNVAGPPCALLAKQLAALRPPQQTIVHPNDHAYENAWLLLYEPASR